MSFRKTELMYERAIESAIQKTYDQAADLAERRDTFRAEIRQKVGQSVQAAEKLLLDYSPVPPEILYTALLSCAALITSTNREPILPQKELVTIIGQLVLDKLEALLDAKVEHEMPE